MSSGVVNFIDKNLSEPMTKLANQRHLRAVRDGIMAALPLIIIGSFFMIIAFPPLPAKWGISIFIAHHVTTILLPYRMTMYIMTLYATFGIGYSLSKSYEIDGLTGGILSSMAFLLTIVPQSIDKVGYVIPMVNLGGTGMFVGIIVSIFAVEIYRFTQKSGFKISMPEQVPPTVARSFEALTAVLIIVLVIGSITYFIGFNWYGFISSILSPLVKAADSLPSVLLIVFLTDLFWIFGIHGASIVGSVATPIWLSLLSDNTAAAASGNAIPHIAVEPFYQWFIWVGGSGCAIGLAICLLLTKSAQLKSLGKIAIVPSVFNINEPLIFGTPIVLNPMLMIPFIVTPLIAGVLAWVTTSLGWVAKATILAPWTLPGPIGAFIATKGDIRAVILCFVIIIISVVIYFPFVKMYDKKLLNEEATTLEGLKK